MDSSADYRRYASECLKLAQEAKPEDKKRLLDMAEAWRALAEKQERKPPGSPKK